MKAARKPTSILSLLQGRIPSSLYQGTTCSSFAATSDAFTVLFGNIGSFTDHTYDYLGFTPRTFGSFRAIGEDAGNSRLYAGIHYQPSINTGLEQGRKVAANIFAKLGLHLDNDK